MMAITSPLSILPYRSASRPYSASSPMSFEIPQTSSNTAENASSASTGNSIGAADISSVAVSPERTGGDEEIDTVKQGHKIVSMAPVRESTMLAQSVPTIETAHIHHLANDTRSDEDEPPQSVIHAPSGFGDFIPEPQKKPQASGDTCGGEETTSPGSQRGERVELFQEPKLDHSPISPRPLTTSVNPTRDWSERATPRAQTRYDFDGPGHGACPRTRSDNLEGIPEGTFNRGEIEINALRAALTECWTLCNTLASLSYINRGHLHSQENGLQDNAWRSCWRLCQKLYDTRDDDYAPQVSPTLDLCRDFCQALFEARVCDDDLADSVLRVSFELNNHLYNTHDRNLPDAFRERTLDFYITLCHRLMKQRTRLTETDSLLSACWTLAEMLFSIRQSKRTGKPLDELLLGSAVQACWELCDIFREGWSLHTLRSSDRGTPRPSQTTFAHAFQQVTQQSGLDSANDPMGQLGNPETPTTIFEDIATVSPDEAPVPNILILGYGAPRPSRPHSRWPPSASSASDKSRSSGQTASVDTVTTVSEDPDFTRLRILITKAAIDSGYQRGGAQTLPSFVKALPTDAFGSAPWQTALLENYRKLISSDPVFRTAGPHAHVGAVDVAHACQAMLQNGQYSWLRDLYRLVFGFHVEDAVNWKGMAIQT